MTDIKKISIINSQNEFLHLDKINKMGYADFASKSKCVVIYKGRQIYMTMRERMNTIVRQAMDGAAKSYVDGSGGHGKAERRLTDISMSKMERMRQALSEMGVRYWLDDIRFTPKKKYIMWIKCRYTEKEGYTDMTWGISPDTAP